VKLQINWREKEKKKKKIKSRDDGRLGEKGVGVSFCDGWRPAINNPRQ
jgi:hypothetical protein